MTLSKESSLAFYGMLFLLEAGFAALIETRCRARGSTALHTWKQNRLRFDPVACGVFAVMVLLPSILMGLRIGVGTDYDHYAGAYERWGSMGLQASARGGFSIEYLNYAVAMLARFVFRDYHGYLFAMYLLTILPVALYLKGNCLKVSFFWTMLLYHCILFPASLNTVRQLTAAAILMLGHKFIFKRQFWRYALVVLIAAMFHTSALLGILLYGLYGRTKNTWRISAWCMAGAFALLPLMSVVMPLAVQIPFLARYRQYLKTMEFSLSVGTILFRLPVLALVVWYRKALFASDKRNRFYVLLYFGVFFSYFAGAFGQWFFRIVYYCEIAEVMLVPQIVRLTKRKLRPYFKWGLAAYYVFYFVYLFYIAGNDGIFPYAFV